MANRPGSNLITCRQCGESFTASVWPLHAHHPDQAHCQLQTCSRKAVGFCQACEPPAVALFRPIAGGLTLCGEHLLEHRRLGHGVRIVDGSVCRLCDGEGQVQSQGVDPETPGGRWARCPHCQGSGYDPDLRPRAARRSPFATPPQPRPSSEPAPPKPPTTPIDWDALVRAREEWLEAEAEQARAKQQDAEAEQARVKQREEEAEQARAKRREAEAEQARAADRELAWLRKQAQAQPQRPRAPRRFPGSRRRPRRMPSLRSAILALAAGVLFGPMFVFPLLPDAAAGPVIELQQWVSDTLG